MGKANFLFLFYEFFSAGEFAPEAFLSEVQSQSASSRIPENAESFDGHNQLRADVDDEGRWSEEFRIER